VDDGTFDVTCPYRGEELTVHVESDVGGTSVQDTLLQTLRERQH